MKINEYSLIAAICRESFYEFVREFWHTICAEKPVWNWHIKYICDEMQIVAERVFRSEPKLYDLIVNVPPGSTKSTIISQMFPAWTWIRMPSCRHIGASYAHLLALSHSLKTRDIVQSELYQTCFPDIQLRDDQNTKGLFVNTHKGSKMAVGVRGQVTGYHAHFLEVDDPLNPEESFSEAELRTVNRWMETTLPLRVVSKEVTPLILVQQRLHQADPSGELLEKERGTGLVKHICLPAEETEDVSPKEEVLKYYRANGGLFDPIRLPRHLLPGLRKKLGEYGYASQMLQSPVPLGGGMFKTHMVKLEKEAPRMTKLVRCWDKAGTQDNGNWSVGVLMGMDKNDEVWVLDVVRGQWGATERERIIKATAEQDARGFHTQLTTNATWTNVIIVIEIEGGSGGKESAEQTVRNLAGFSVVTFHPTGDKQSRAHPFASQMGIKDNVHVLDRPWTRDYLQELRYFPHGKNDDQVDGSSGGYNYLARAPRVAGGIRAMAMSR